MSNGKGDGRRRAVVPEENEAMGFARTYGVWRGWIILEPLRKGGQLEAMKAQPGELHPVLMNSRQVAESLAKPGQRVVEARLVVIS